MRIQVVPLLIAAGLCLIASEAPAQIGGRFASMEYGRPSLTSSPRTYSYAVSSRARHSASVHPRLILAARLAESNAERRSTRYCWRYVKRALVRANAVPSYPSSVYAKQAARELTTRYGFVKLPVRSPYKAPVGAVLVYGGRGAGHVEIRTSTGFVSDYRSRHPSALPFIGAYVKGS